MTREPGIAILGLGLMGASLALALRKRGYAGRLVAFARKETTRREALARGIVDEAFADPDAAVAAASLAVLCAPIRACVELAADVAPALRAWREAGHRLAVYSSGSVPAQKLLFSHTDAGDLAPLFDGFFDTEVGGKREAGSYRAIADALGALPKDVLFLSDVVAELDAAREAGMRTALLDRREDYPEPRLGEATHGHARVEGFDAIEPDA